MSGHKADAHYSLDPNHDQSLRKDAEQNRRRILVAARALFVEQGMHISFTDIAQEAGCGVGTVYRRFPNKWILLDALLDERADELRALARVGLDNADPWDALSEFLHGAIDAMGRDRGLQELLLCRSQGSVRQSEAQAEFKAAASRIWERARLSRVVRSDVTKQDIAAIQIMLSAIIDAASDIDPELWRRYLAFVLRGIRADPTDPQPLPVASLNDAQLDFVMARRHPFSRHHEVRS